MPQKTHSANLWKSPNGAGPICHRCPKPEGVFTHRFCCRAKNKACADLINSISFCGRDVPRRVPSGGQKSSKCRDLGASRR